MSKSAIEAGVLPDGSAVPAEDAERLMSAVMHGMTSTGTTADRIRVIFAGAQPLFGADSEFQLHLHIRLDREPAPLLLDRIWYGDVYDQIEPRPVTVIQSMIDAHGKVMRARVERAKRNIHSPCTRVMKELFGADASVDVTQRYLTPLGFRDAILSDWLSSPDRILTLLIVRKSSLPFSAVDLNLCSILMHALAPIMDQHVARRKPSPLTRLSVAQLESLRGLLTAQPVADPEVLKRLLSFFDAQTREALVTKFVNQAFLDEIDELLHLYALEEA